MKNLSSYFLCLLFLTFFEVQAQYRTELIPMGGGLEVTWDNYQKTDRLPVIIFCHQAGWSRGEYLEIIPKVRAWGFTCMAVDLRSGGEVNGVVNQTAARAKKEGLPTGAPVSRLRWIPAFIASDFNVSTILDVPAFYCVGQTAAISFVIVIMLRCPAAFPGEA